MYEWNRNIQRVVNSIENSIKAGESDDITLLNLSKEIAYSPFHTTRQFKELTGILLRDYLRLRKLAYSVIDLRDSRLRILDIAVKYGFSSQEAYARAFKKAYSITPDVYRRNPGPLLLRNKANTFDPYYLGIGENNMDKTKLQEIKVWIETIPAHKVLFLKHYESKGYWDFWEKQDKVPGCDCNTISGLMDSIKGKLDGNDNELGVFSGQLMFYIYEEDGRVPECYGIRVPADYKGELPPQLYCKEVPEGDYIIFAHPTFDYDTMSSSVMEEVTKVSGEYDLDAAGYEYEEKNGRIRYIYHSPDVWGYRIVRPVKKK
jgi:AraC-like DNA-binding protein